MIVTAWNNGDHNQSGAGYGIKISTEDRDQFFKRAWRSVILEFEGTTVQAEVNIDKPSFWNPQCRELIKQEIGIWLRANGLSSWPPDDPPRLSLEQLSNRRFLLRRS